MSANRWLATLLIVVGLLGAAYGGFSYVKDTHQANIPPLSFKLTEKEHIDIPPWLSLVAIVGGCVLLVASRKT